MGKQRKTEEQLKADIFSIFSRYLSESSSDRRQVYFGRLCEAIISWCTNYLSIKANEMGIEIYNLAQRLVKENNTKTPRDKNGFFKYLKKALYTAKAEYYRHNETGRIDIPRETRKRLKILGDIITTREGNAGRKITENERRQCISEWFGITEYSELLNLINTGSLDFTSNNIGDTSASPQDEYFAKLGVLEIKAALELVLQNTQERSRECYRALFTAYCIDRSIDFEGLAPLLDCEILETYRKDGKKPRQHEIYLKYHPEVKRTSAEAMASKMINDFLKKLYSSLK